jgi:hypothetical protein
MSRRAVGAFACLLIALFCLTTQSAAQSAAAAIWTGPNGKHVIAWTRHPGEHVSGDVLLEAPLTYLRTGRLAADYVAPTRNGEFRIPAGTAAFATTFVYIKSADSPAISPRDSAPGTHFWCALPEPDGFVCFNLSASGQVHYYRNYFGSGRISNRAPWIEAGFPGPQPEIAEQRIDIDDPHRIEYALTEFNEAGFVLSITHRYGSEVQRPYQLPRAPWGDYRCDGYARGIVMAAHPVRSSDGSIRAVRIEFID